MLFILKTTFILLGLLLFATQVFRGGRGRLKGAGTARKTAGLIFITLFYLFFRGIEDHALLDPFEGMNASVALNMAMSGNFTAPAVGGYPYAGTGMGFWWLSAFSLYADWSELSVRLWPVLGGLGMVVGGWFIAMRTGGGRAANYAAVITGSSPLLYAASQLASPHALYGCFVTLSLLGIIYALRSPHFFILLHGGAVLAFVVYGPAGAVLPWLALLFYAVLAGQERFFLKALFYWPGLLVTVLAGGGYVLFLNAKNPYLLTLMTHNIPGDAFNSLTWSFIAMLLGCLPWLGALPGALRRAFPFQWGLVLPSEKPNALLLSWCVVFLFFGAFARDAMLIVTVVPVTGVLCASHLAQAVEKKDLRLLRTFVALDIVLMVPLLAVGLPYIFLTEGALRHVFMPMALCACFYLLFLFAGWHCARTRRLRKLMPYMCVLVMLSLLPAARVFDLLEDSFSARDAGIYIRNAAKEDDVLLVQYALNHPSFAFYAGKTGALPAHTAPNPKIPGQRVIDDEVLHKIWQEGRRVFMLIDSSQKFDQDQRLPGIVHNIHSNRGKIVLSNRSDSEILTAPVSSDSSPQARSAISKTEI